jgi:hypothetical protein
MKKFIRRLLLFLVLIIVGLGIILMSFVNSIQYVVTESDLPQDVYESDSNLLVLAKLKIVGLVLADEDDQYSMIEEIMNLIILDSIQDNINSSYSPLSDCEEDVCQYIYKDSPFYINYAYAYLNDNNQIVIVISGGTDKYMSVDTALQLVFDVDVDILNMSVDFTLHSYSLGNRDLSLKMLDFIMDKMDKDAIENDMTFGELDLDTYTYTISITDAF